MSEEGLQIAEKRREVKGKGEKERHTHLNAEFQRIARRAKKALLRIGWRGRSEGGSEWGVHVNQWLINVNVSQKPLQYCEVISLQLIKINGKKKKESPPQ